MDGILVNTDTRRAERLRAGALVASGGLIVAVAALPLLGRLAGHAALPAWDRWVERRAIVAAMIPYAIALAAARGRVPQRRLVLAVAGGACAVLFVVASVGSRDVFSYLFYGRMLAHGHLNPLAVDPSRMASDRWYALVGWRHTPSVYGPIWTYVCAAASLLWPHVVPAALLLKALSIAGAAVGCVAAAGMAGDDEGARTRALLFMLWNPLVLFSIAGDGHVDGLLIGFIVGAVAARRRDRMGIATALLLAASLVKLYCGIFLLLHVVGFVLERRRTWRVALGHAGASLGVAVAAYAPLWARRETFAGVARVGAFFGATLPGVVRDVAAAVLRGAGDGAQHALLEGADVARLVSVAALAIVLGVLLVRMGRSGREAALWGAAFAVYLLAATWFMPWHALPLVPLAALQRRPDRAARGFAAGVLVLGVTSMYAVPLVRFGLPLAAAAAVMRFERLRSPVSE